MQSTIEKQTEYVCKICSNIDNNRPYVAKEMMFGLRDEFTYFQCSNCNCLQIATFPDNISKYYDSKEYYSFNEPDVQKYKGIIGLITRKLVQSNVMPINWRKTTLSYLFSLKNLSFLGAVVKSAETKILDVGCGNGSKFLYPLYESGFKYVMGCDPFINSDIIYPNGLKITNKELTKIEGKWDIICFNHSFEHIGNPLETLKKANELLNDGGYCIIRIPTASSYAWKHYGVNWFQLDAPRHFFLYSIESIKHLAKQTSFDLKDYYSDSTHHQFTISERYKQNKSIKERVYNTKLGKISHTFLKLKYMIKAASLNRIKLGDQAVFYLRKK